VVENWKQRYFIIRTGGIMTYYTSAEAKAVIYFFIDLSEFHSKCSDFDFDFNEKIG
jgi:hypothetical protein